MSGLPAMRSPVSQEAFIARFLVEALAKLVNPMICSTGSGRFHSHFIDAGELSPFLPTITMASSAIGPAPKDVSTVHRFQKSDDYLLTLP